MSNERIENSKLLLSIISTFCLVMLVPLNAWALKTIVDLQNRVSIVETEFRSFASPGPRYTAVDAERDQGVVLKLLESQGKFIDDHEGRIRILEKLNR